ncbi:EexN family lipoprotein [Bartonella sp. WD16.2]|uniref:EexN family lipoprotein n=1 Tax=Bartonella sp. WD16.2 TaxID=1933904 RepID=UPI00099ABC71|nr:EexN family lipoprotein [Bartonella sp. WD16.2]AQX20323.1 hypothetical protein BWD162_012250 [Bartonella sp. WD16.2]
MNKIIITTLLLCAGLIITGCEKTYSVEEFKKDEKLLREWVDRCGTGGQSKNCQNARIAEGQRLREYYKNLHKELWGDSDN